MQILSFHLSFLLQFKYFVGIQLLLLFPLFVRERKGIKIVENIHLLWWAMVDIIGGVANYDGTAIWYKSSKMGERRAVRRRSAEQQQKYPI